MKPVSLVDRQPGHNRGNGSHISAETRPLSPPDTEISSQLDQYATPPRRPSLAHQDSGYGLPTIPATPDIPRESAGARFRRLAGIPTTQSGPREFRGASRPQTRWLIVLMPPSHLTDELAVGHRSPGRIANGLLIPLFPTLFAQLTAIAKEFSLPSTTGLCLYLHLPDVPATPRITDETWPLLWSRHLHTDDSALPLGLPVAGRVEFDIDVPNARWYPMWFAHVSRHELVPDLARAIPPSPRGAGRDLSPNPSIRAARSVPRPLALVPRDEPVVHVGSAPSPAPSPSRPSIPKTASKETVEKVRRWSALVTPDPALRADAPPTEPSATEEATVPSSRDEITAPLAEEATPEDEPLNLEDFQWSISSAGPPSPTSSCATSASSRVVSIHLLDRNEGSVLLTPTTATTWGPPSVSDVESDFNLDLGWRVHSPDIGERVEGSVLLTPSTATSWGAPLSYPPTPAQWIEMQQLVQSPGLGERAEGSVLLTPSTATTWGAPLSYPPTPAQWYAMQQYVRSPDAGQRAEGSVLLTPSTATTWGAPETYPPTPEAWSEAQWGRVASPDLGARAEVEGEFGRGRYSIMVWGAEVETEQEAYARMGLPWVWEFGWPMLEDAGLSIVPEGVEQNIPDMDDQEVEEMAPVVLVTRGDAPEMEIEPYNYAPLGLAGDDTSLEIEGNSALDEGQSGEFYTLGSEHGLEVDAGAFEYDLPSFEPIPVDEEDEPVNTGISSAFEYELPHFELVEGEEEDQDEDEGEYAGPDAVTPDTFDYPLDYELHTSDIRAEHTAFVNSPGSIVTTKSVAVAAVTVVSTTTATTTRTHSYGAYPYLMLYPAVYPHLELYPAAPAATVSTFRPTLGLATQSRVVDVERLQIVDAPKATPAADSVEPSPVPIERMSSSAGTTPSSVEFAASPVESIRSASSQIESSVPSPASRRPSLSVHVPRARSSTIVAVNPADGRSRAWSRALPPVPPVPREVLESLESKKSVTASAVPRRLHVAKKPSIVLEDTEFELLPSEKKPALSTAYPYRYPYNLAQLYPSVRTLGYPYNLDGLYPSVVKTQESARAVSVSALATKYTVKQSGALLGTHPVVRQTAYPVFDLYPAVYPHNLLELYPPVLASVPGSTQSTPTSHGSLAAEKQTTSAASRVPAKSSSDARVRLSPQYPTFDLFPAVYPHNLECIYPSFVKTFAAAVTPSNKNALATKPIAKPSSASLEARSAIRQKGYPVFDLYPAVYPYNLLELYPPVLAPISQPARSAETNNGKPTAGKRTASVTFGVPAKRLSGVRVRFSSQYPTFNLFPAVYPHNLDCIYPTSIKALVATVPVSSKGTLHKELSVPEPVHTTSNALANTQSVYLARVYPNIELYAPVYPFNLDIYPSVRAKSSVVTPINSVLQQKVSETVAESNTDKEAIKPAPKTRKTHAQLYAEARHKTHAQLVAEVAKDAAPTRIRKTHDELQAEVFPGGLPSPVITTATSPQVMVTSATDPEPSSAPQPTVAPLRRQRSGTIMMRGPPVPAESVPPVPPLPQGADLARSRSMLEARTQMFERAAAPARSQTISAPRLVRGKNASFERAMSLFHEETGKAGSEGSRTPPRVSKTISKLDMSKFKFS